MTRRWNDELSLKKDMMKNRLGILAVILLLSLAAVQVQTQSLN
jgi:hypothetical protein